MEPMTSDEALVPVYHTNNELDAQLYRAMLEGEGLQVLQESRPTYASHAMRPELYPHFRLLAYAHDAPRAAELIEAYRLQVESGALALADDEAPEDASTAEDNGSRGAVMTAASILFGIIALVLALLSRGSNNSLLFIAAIFVGLAVAIQLTKGR